MRMQHFVSAEHGEMRVGQTNVEKVDSPKKEIFQSAEHEKRVLRQTNVEKRR